MRRGIVHQDEHPRASQTTALQYLDHVVDMSRKDFGRHCGARREHVVENHAIDGPSHGEKHLLGMLTGFRDWFWLLLFVDPLTT
jgi:hypothetical protein